MKTAFLDSSVLFSAVNSPMGGSSKLFTLTKIELVTSPLVLTEVERNVREKLQSYHLDRFFMLVGKFRILDQNPDEVKVKEAEKVIVAKDAVILAEAKRSKADFLVTLDKKHFLTDPVEKFLGEQRAATPKMLIQASV